MIECEYVSYFEWREEKAKKIWISVGIGGCRFTVDEYFVWENSIVTHVNVDAPYSGLTILTQCQINSLSRFGLNGLNRIHTHTRALTRFSPTKSRNVTKVYSLQWILIWKSVKTSVRKCDSCCTAQLSCIATTFSLILCFDRSSDAFFRHIRDCNLLPSQPMPSLRLGSVLRAQSRAAYANYIYGKRWTSNNKEHWDTADTLTDCVLNVHAMQWRCWNRSSK